MSIKDPTLSVSKKGKHVPRKTDVNKNSLPEWTQQDITEHDITRFIDHSESNEINYLKRLKLRHQVLQGVHSDLVPPISGLEAEIGIQLKKLNLIALDPAHKMKLDLLCLKFKTDSIYEIAKGLAVAKMERQSVQEVQRLVDAEDIIDGIDKNYDFDSRDNLGTLSRYRERQLRTS